MLRLYGSERRDITDESNVFCSDPDCIGEPYGVEAGILVKHYNHQVMTLVLV